VIRWRISSHTCSFGRLEAVSVALLASAASANAPTRSMNAKSQPTVAVSYSWDAEKKGPYVKEVDSFCALLRKRDIAVIRDTGAIPFGGSFIDFMVRLSEHDRVAVFLSEDYLKSPNCTFELVTLWEKCGRNESDFFKKVRVWIMSEAAFRLNSAAIDLIEKHWEKEAKKLAEGVQKRIKKKRVVTAKTKEMEGIERISRELPDLLGRIAGRLSPQNGDAFSDWIASEFPNDGVSGRTPTSGPPLGKEQTSGPGKPASPPVGPPPPLEEIFPGICRLVDGVLEKSPSLATFLGEAFRDVLETRGNSTRLRRLPAGERSRYAEAIGKLAQWARRRPRVEVDARDLADVVGGVAVLTLDPAWVLVRRKTLSEETIKVPGREQRLSLADGQTADFLHLVVQGLIDGAAQLKTLFGDGSKRRIQKPISTSLRGVGEAGLIPAAKRYIIAATRPSTADFDKLEEDQLEQEYENSRKVLERARNTELDPYSCSDPDTVGILGPYREKLKLNDLVLILPAGADSEAAIVGDHINLMSDLKLIFDHLKPHIS